MKRLSEVMSDLGEDETPAENPLPYPTSSLADPPISTQEALAAEIAICRRHRSEYGHLNVEGAVYFCPIGRMYWRCHAKSGGMFKPLRYN